MELNLLYSYLMEKYFANCIFRREDSVIISEGTYFVNMQDFYVIHRKKKVSKYCYVQYHETTDFYIIMLLTCSSIFIWTICIAEGSFLWIREWIQLLYRKFGKMMGVEGDG